LAWQQTNKNRVRLMQNFNFLKDILLL